MQMSEKRSCFINYMAQHNESIVADMRGMTKAMRGRVERRDERSARDPTVSDREQSRVGPIPPGAHKITISQPL